MKIEDVPQDGQIFGENNSTRDLCYAVDEQGRYRQVISMGWQPKNEAILQAWELINEEAEEARQSALCGKESPLRYHMIKNLLDLSFTAQYTGFSKKTIKKHFDSAQFNNLSMEILEKYAKVLNISVAELRSVSQDS